MPCDLDIDALSQEAERRGYNGIEQVVIHLRDKLARDAAYLERRLARGTQTSHDSQTRLDILVIARAIVLFQQE